MASIGTGVGFTSLPPPYVEGMNTPQATMLEALRQNMAFLIEGNNGGSSVILKSQVSVDAPTSRQLEAVSASGHGYTIQGVNVASLDDVTKLIVDVQKLSNDVQVLYNTLTTLIAQLKA